MHRRTTISQPVEAHGVGLHSGQEIALRLEPAPTGTGIVFVRTDRDDAEIPATVDHLARLAYATTLACGGISVGTVEHLLSATAGLGIDDLRVLIDGDELPVLDGSARPFVALLGDAGRVTSTTPRQVMRIRRAVSVRDGERWMRVEPARSLQISYTIDFDHPAIGHSERLFTVEPRAYAKEIAPARTFCRAEEVEALHAAGLARGGSLENALVVGPQGLLNGPLRFSDEFVRHKILDLIGDLALLGAPLLGRVTAVRAGHALHARLMATLLEERQAWSLEPAGRMPVAAGPMIRTSVAAATA